MTPPPSGLAAYPSLAANPVLSSWLAFSPDGTVTIRPGKVEYGQGVWTALAQVAAEELDVALARVTVAPVSTGTSPDEGVTSGSLSIQHSGSALRQACAQARALLLAEAAGKLGTAAAELAVEDGQILAAGQPTGLNYWSLAGPGLLDREAGDPVPVKPPDRWSVAGRSAPRLDLPDKVTGRPRFLHDMVLPGMLYGRVVRPPAVVAELLSTGDPDLPPDVIAVRDGSFLGVVAATDAQALRAARLVAKAAQWQVTESLPDDRDLKGFLLSAPAEDVPVESRHDEEAAASVTTPRTAEYTRPFLAHASMAPSCAIARWDSGTVTAWSHSQGIFALRDALAAGLRLDPAQVTVNHAEGAGAYGHNGADDAALDAVLLARAVPGRPVRVLWSREDEMSWAPLGPAMLARLSAGLDARGRIVTWRQDVWSNGFIGRPGRGGDPRLLALAHLAGGQPMPPAPDGPPTGAMGSTRNAVPGYDIPDLEVVRHRLLTDADQDLFAAVPRCVPQRVRDRVVHGRTGRMRRGGPGRVPAGAPDRPAGGAGDRGGGGVLRLGGPPRAGGHRLRDRLRQVQGPRRVLRRGGRGRGRVTMCTCGACGSRSTSARSSTRTGSSTRSKAARCRAQAGPSGSG